MKSKEAYSKASKERQARIPKEERVRRARARAHARWSKATWQERRAHAMKMVKARQECRRKTR